MRFEKFTTKLQEALAEAQSIALGKDQQYIEPEHLLLAMLNQEDGGAAGLLAKAGGNVNRMRQELEHAISRMPTVHGTPGEVMLSLTPKANADDAVEPDPELGHAGPG